MSVTNAAVLPVREQTVNFLAWLLTGERARRGTRAGTRALPAHNQAILVLRWFLDGTRMRQFASDNQISISTGYGYLHEGIDVLAARTPGLHGALLAAKAAGHDYVSIDGTVIETDRCRTPGPTESVDLWWSGKHDNHGGNIQVITAPDGWPIWTSEVRPGREHDTTAVRRHAAILPALTQAGADLRTLGDLGYEGLADTVTVAFKRPKNGGLLLVQQQFNKAHNGLRAIGERGNSLLKMTFQSAAQHQPQPLAHREDRRRCPDCPPHRTRPHHMTISSQPLARNGSLAALPYNRGSGDPEIETVLDRLSPPTQ